MKKWVGLIAVAILVVGGYFIASPYLAASALKTAAIEGDGDSLETSVDFPAVRESLKSQMTIALNEKMQNDPEMSANPFSGLAMLMVPKIVDQAIDVYVTPEGLAQLAQGKKPKADNAPASDGTSTEFEYEWVSIDRFRVTPKTVDGESTPPSLLFERRGFSDWKLIRLELPDDMFDEA